MNDDELEQFRQMDWGAIAAKVANFAADRAALRYRWKGDILPSGRSAEDLAYEAIGEFWENSDRYPGGTCSVTTFLCGVVKQKLWNLFKLKEAQTTDPEADIEKIVDQDGPSSPDAVAETQDLLTRAFALLYAHPKVKGKDDHEMVIAALEAGKIYTEEIEQETGIARTRIYQVQRELRQIFRDVAKTLQNDKGA